MRIEPISVRNSFNTDEEGDLFELEILRVINNNVISAINDDNKEVVIMGKGIGFKKHNGDMVDDSQIEKIFLLSEQSLGEFEQLIKEMPYDEIRISNKIVHEAKKIVNRKLNNNIYITLTDHLNSAIIRAKENIIVKNALLWEIKRFYPEEYKAGLMARTIVLNELGVELPEDEAGFFALHIVNAEIGGGASRMADVTEVIKDVFNIISYTFGTTIDREGIYYERFVTHLRFFFERASKGEEYSSNDEVFNEMVRNLYPASYRCALRIRDYIMARMKYTIMDEELTYLTLHIQRITNTI